eukprot:1390881-Amphidinium_carterae.1
MLNDGYGFYFWWNYFRYNFCRDCIWATPTRVCFKAGTRSKCSSKCLDGRAESLANSSVAYQSFETRE